MAIKETKNMRNGEDNLSFLMDASQGFSLNLNVFLAKVEYWTLKFIVNSIKD
ncbi:hypothetical protein [Desulforamulus ruminis]|uniref:hypothetical protein n=1 Tax=Desulforamulus ruminis TaxID=1564 RepID=UPI002356747E|nr:hypothetical protein [Desulforamulus ruminis]